MATESPPGTRGTTAPPFARHATEGRTWSLVQVPGANGIVVAFICNHCPYVKAELPAMICDAIALRELGVGFVAINANDALAYPDDAYPAMVALAADNALPFPYLHDDTQAVARAYGPVCTREFFGFDAQRMLRYRGRLDASRRHALPDARRELVSAMRELVTTGAMTGE